MGSQVRALLFPPFRPLISPELLGAVVQLVRTPACHAGGRGFKSLPRRHFSSSLSGRRKNKFASVAQLVEQRTENPRVVGSIPTGGTILRRISCGGPKCECSSSGRAPPCQGGGSEFEPRHSLQTRGKVFCPVFPKYCVLFFTERT